MRDKSRRAADWLADIVHWGEKLERYVAGMTLEAFVEDDRTVDAATKCIEAIGEAANRLLKEPPEMQRQYKTLPLREAYLARNQLTHGYFNVDRKLVWQMSQSAIPDFVLAVKQVLAEIESGDADDR